MLCFLQRRPLHAALSRAQHFENSLLVCPDSGNENFPIILGRVDLLRHGQSTTVQCMGHDVVVIFAMLIR
jgi:hypothetical protein